MRTTGHFLDEVDEETSISQQDVELTSYKGELKLFDGFVKVERHARALRRIQVHPLQSR